MKSIDELTNELIKEINTLSKKHGDNPVEMIAGVRRMVTKIYKTGYVQGLSVFQSFTDEHKN